MNRFFLFSLMIFLIFLTQGCLNTYLQNVSNNVQNNINSINTWARLDAKEEVDNSKSKKEATFYSPTGSPMLVDYSTKCDYGTCVYFMCENLSGFPVKQGDSLTTSPYYYLYHINLSKGSCFVYIAASNSELDEQNLKNQLLSSKDYSIRRIALSQGFSFYSANDANPSAKNYIMYPIFVIRGTKSGGYRLSPLIKNSIKCYLDKNTIPVFIFYSRDGIPSDNSMKEIVDWIASLDSTSIVFTDANIFNPDYLPNNPNSNPRKLFSSQANSVAEQLNVIYDSCKTSNPDILNCVPGISLPYNGNNLKITYDFYDEVRYYYNLPYSRDFYSFYKIVGFPLISSKASSCNGYSLFSDAVRIAKMFAYDSYGGILRPVPVFIQSLTFDAPKKPGDCDFNEVTRRQTFYALYHYAIPAFAKLGIINVPGKKYHNEFDPFDKVYDNPNNPFPQASYESQNWHSSYWADKSGSGNIVDNDKKKEYSFYYSYAQEYYKNINYPRVVYRNGVGGATCPFQDDFISIKYEDEKKGSETRMDELYEVNPSWTTPKNVFDEVYRCDTCFSHESPDVFLKEYYERYLSTISCFDFYGEKINEYASQFAVDPEFEKAIADVELSQDYSYNVCNIDYQREGNPACLNVDKHKLDSALISAGCDTLEDRGKYYYDEIEGVCKPEDYFNSNNINLATLTRCVPCGFGLMGSRIAPSNQYTKSTLPSEIGYCKDDPTQYNPFINNGDNICVASAELAKYIKLAQEFVNNHQYDLDINSVNVDRRGYVKDSTVAFVAAYLYKYGENAGNDLLDEIDAIKNMKHYRDCNYGDEQTMHYCCDYDPDLDGWKFAGYKSCCKDNAQSIFTDCNEGKIGFISKIMSIFKGAMDECKLCYNSDWKEHACNYAEEITKDNDLCNGVPPSEDYFNPWESWVSTEDMRKLIEDT